MTALDQEARDALTQARMAEALESLEAVNLLKDNGFYSIAMTRLYYACFYAASALLIRHDIYTKTHAGVKHKIHECFRGFYTAGTDFYRCGKKKSVTFSK